MVRVIFQLIRWGKQKGILNHDLKPENFMFKVSPFVQILLSITTLNLISYNYYMSVTKQHWLDLYKAHHEDF